MEIVFDAGDIFNVIFYLMKHESFFTSILFDIIGLPNDSKYLRQTEGVQPHQKGSQHSTSS